METLTLDIPEGIETSFTDGTLTVKGPKGEIVRPFPSELITLKTEKNTLTLTTETTRKKDRSLSRTWRAHITNMMTGVQAGWEAKMKVVYLHFPIKFIVEDQKVKISNFLGEKADRETQVLPGVEITFDKDVVTVTGVNKESVGNQCSNIEQLTKVQGRDRRVFADGVWLFQKPQPIEKEAS